MTKALEDKLICLKNDIKDLTMNEVKKLKKNKTFNSLQHQHKQTKRFLTQNNLLVVPSDKSNRLVISENNSFKERNSIILEDSNTYNGLRLWS